MIKFDFAGSRPGRVVLTPEAVCAHLFEECNASGGPGVNQGDYFREILGLRGATQRDAYVVGSMIQWLGTRCGVTFLSEAKARATAGNAGNLETVFVRRWMEENVRLTYMNEGHTASELLLNSRPYPDPLTAKCGFSFVDPVSKRDERVILAVMRWLARDEGQSFLAEAERRIEYMSEMSRGLFDRLNN